jgi:hypothetical protein
VEISLHRGENEGLLLLSDEHRMVVEGQVALSERQMKIIEFIHTYSLAKKGDLIRFYHISGPAAGKELAQMVKQNLTRTKRKMAYYVMRVRAFS